MTSHTKMVTAILGVFCIGFAALTFWGISGMHDAEESRRQRERYGPCIERVADGWNGRSFRNVLHELVVESGQTICRCKEAVR